jgi:hypothetical protein
VDRFNDYWNLSPVTEVVQHDVTLLQGEENAEFFGRLSTYITRVDAKTGI